MDVVEVHFYFTSVSLYDLYVYSVPLVVVPTDI